MNDMEKQLRLTKWFFLSLLIITAVFMCKQVFVDGSRLAVNPLNPRLKRDNPNVLRGKILDRNNEVLAYSEENSTSRVYPYADVFAHVVGYYDKRIGTMGAESIYNFKLSKPGNEIRQYIRQLTSEQRIEGDSLVLTLDASLQDTAYKLMKGRKGSVIAIEPSTGKILAMVSIPAFDPNKIAENWSSLSGDAENSTLVNRAISGKYPPGSVFKIVTATAALRNASGESPDPAITDMVYNCEGQANFNGKIINCFDSVAHGQEDMSRAFALSCNTYFAMLAERIGPDALNEVADDLYFNKTISFPISAPESAFNLSNPSAAELVESAIGQGKTMATPLHMAMITAAIANKGIMMKPYIADYFLIEGMDKVSKTMPSMEARLFPSEEAQKLTTLMESVTTEGTARGTEIKGIRIASKTGSAQNPIGDDHGWYVGFAPIDEPKIAVCVMLENIGGSKHTMGIAKGIYQEYLK